MSFKYTPNTLKKLEELYEESRYIIRYEKGNFNSGYCILEERRVVVINKFFSVEGRINALLEILGAININEEELGGDTLKWYKQIQNELSLTKKAEEQAAAAPEAKTDEPADSNAEESAASAEPSQTEQ